MRLLFPRWISWRAYEYVHMGKFLLCTDSIFLLPVALVFLGNNGECVPHYTLLPNQWHLSRHPLLHNCKHSAAVFMVEGKFIKLVLSVWGSIRGEGMKKATTRHWHTLFTLDVGIDSPHFQLLVLIASHYHQTKVENIKRWRKIARKKIGIWMEVEVGIVWYLDRLCVKHKCCWIFKKFC